MALPKAARGLDAQYHDRFSEFFEVVRAETPDLLKKVYEVRYQVYCVERDFENPADNPSGLEKDQFDDRSVHSLLAYRPTGDIAGTVRLVLPSAGGTEPDFPMQAACEGLKDWPAQLLPPGETAEISRFTVSKQFRQRVSDTLYADAVTDRSDAPPLSSRRSLPYITIGLFKAVAEMSYDNGINYWCAIMDPALIRMLSRLGVYFNPLGPLVDYHGWRQPCYANLSEVASILQKRRSDIFQATVN